MSQRRMQLPRGADSIRLRYVPHALCTWEPNTNLLFVRGDALVLRLAVLGRPTQNQGVRARIERHRGRHMDTYLDEESGRIVEQPCDIWTHIAEVTQRMFGIEEQVIREIEPGNVRLRIAPDLEWGSLPECRVELLQLRTAAGGRLEPLPQ